MLVGVILAIAIWWGFFPPGTSDSVFPLANVYLLGGAGLVYGLWAGDDVPRLRRHLAGILALTVLSLVAFAGGWWVQERREARLQQPLENPDFK
jgi:hypothetical protein